MRRRGNGRLSVRCDFIGSSTKFVSGMKVFVTADVQVGDFLLYRLNDRLSRTSRMTPERCQGDLGWLHQQTGRPQQGLKLENRDSGLQTGDPAGFTLADTLACGTVGHIIGVGVVLGLKNLGAI
ncbi:photosystem I subunit K [Actinidia rufa]|uniref:PSI-K n=1 Tax=Actinidia rufa TaxID=165716 RepID=A0A7J0DLZ8_9ERIC|nr:photosystem I subunit K [Actinidia rufa]